MLLILNNKKALILMDLLDFLEKMAAVFLLNTDIIAMI